jgi:hypothetical protein
MCYSVESSAKTTLLSLVAIVVMLRSNVPHFMWIGLIMVGWCGMQFVEMLLWLTNPRKSCTPMNKLITLTLIPLVLISQPLCVLFGSFFVKPWSECSNKRKLFIVTYSMVVTFCLLVDFYKDAEKYCTVVTPEGHLHWWLSNFTSKYSSDSLTKYYIWLFLLAVPIFMLWNISFKAIVVIAVLPLFGFFYGLRTDSNGSIWCHYTSYTAIISLVMYGLYKFKIYNILK